MPVFSKRRTIDFHDLFINFIYCFDHVVVFGDVGTATGVIATAAYDVPNPFRTIS